MLIISRWLGQGLLLRLPSGAEVTVEVLRRHGGNVRLGISAPREVSVLRAELLAAAANSPPPAR